MKIKEVIEKTGLTDRAVRLYIDEGLAVPSIEESYSGRKSIDFSESDVERLKNVALLRKAGFSIADIKSIVDDSTTAKDIVGKFIEQTENNIAHKTEIVEKLKGISFDEDVTLETICNSLSATVEEKEVPKEDLKISVFEKVWRTVFCSFGGWGMLISVASFIIYEITLRNSFIHPTFSSPFFPIVIHSGFTVMFVISAVLLRINIGQYYSSTKKSVRYLNSAIIPVVFVLLFVITFVFSFFSLLAADSITENYNKYMKIDKWVEENYGHKISSIFPPEIPETANKNSIKYFYRHTYTLDPNFDIFAEWKLPKDEYEKAKNINFSDKYSSLQTDNWNCIYSAHIEKYGEEISYYMKEESYIFRNNGWQDNNYLITIFAYNDQEQKVRYITSFSVDSLTDGPYYLSLDW